MVILYYTNLNQTTMTQTPGQIANEQIAEKGICNVTFKHQNIEPEKGILIAHTKRLKPSPFNHDYLFLFVGFRTGTRIACGFNKTMHPRIEFRSF